MSNEKPVRITVGDVTEVAEATAVQKESPISSVAARSAPTVDKSGNGLVYIGGLVGCLFFLGAGYMGLVHGVKPVDVPESAITKTKKQAMPPADGANKPAADSSTANNAATSTNSPSSATNDERRAATTNAPSLKDASNNAPATIVKGPADKAVSPPPASNNAPSN